MLLINNVFRVLVILFLSFISFAQKENSGNLFEVSINGKKWLFDTSLNNFSEQINGVSSIEKELIRLEEINNNYRLPTYTELELMLTQKVALAAYPQKQECLKICICSQKWREENFWGSNFKFPDNVDCPYHRCIKCKSWTELQKKYNPCTFCDNTGHTYCGKSYVCEK